MVGCLTMFFHVFQRGWNHQPAMYSLSTTKTHFDWTDLTHVQRLKGILLLLVATVGYCSVFWKPWFINNCVAAKIDHWFINYRLIDIFFSCWLPVVHHYHQWLTLLPMRIKNDNTREALPYLRVTSTTVPPDYVDIWRRWTAKANRGLNSNFDTRMGVSQAIWGPPDHLTLTIYSKKPTITLGFPMAWETNT